MKIDDILSAKGVAFLLLFSALVLVADNINFSKIVGSEASYFTFFQFIGPIAGGFLGAGVGALSVLVAELFSFAWLGKELDVFNVLRLLPMLFAAVYFANYRKGKLMQAVIPVGCMALFVANPIGAQAWFYSVYWLIPAFALMLPEKLFLRSLGSTFTAHAIGSVTWLYFMPSTPEMWIALIPVVAFERGLFALGINVSYVAFNTLFSRVEAIMKSGIIAIDRRYVIAPARAKA